MDFKTEELMADFIKVAALSGIPLSGCDIQYEALPTLYRRPGSLPGDRKAVYVFSTAMLVSK